MSLKDVAMNNFEWDQAKGSGESESIEHLSCYCRDNEEVKSGATSYPASLTKYSKRTIE